MNFLSSMKRNNKNKIQPFFDKNIENTDMEIQLSPKMDAETRNLSNILRAKIYHLLENIHKNQKDLNSAMRKLDKHISKLEKEGDHDKIITMLYELIEGLESNVEQTRTPKSRRRSKTKKRLKSKRRKPHPPEYSPNKKTDLDTVIQLPSKTNTARRSRALRRRNRKKNRKTKKNCAGCACYNSGNCSCRRRARMEAALAEQERQALELRKAASLKKLIEDTLKKAKQLKLKDENGNDFTEANVREAERAIQNHMAFKAEVDDLFLPTAEVTQPTAVVQGIPIVPNRWTRFKNFFKRRSRKINPVSIVPEGRGRKKTCRKKRKKKQKKNLAGNPEDPKTLECLKKEKVYYPRLMEHVNQLPSWQKDLTRNPGASHDPFFGPYVGGPLMGYTVSSKGGRRKKRNRRTKKR